MTAKQAKEIGVVLVLIVAAFWLLGGFAGAFSGGAGGDAADARRHRDYLNCIKYAVNTTDHCEQYR